ncbi:MAG: Rho termination factor N-terminal domain-containing protein [Blastococcus sp.]
MLQVAKKLDISGRSKMKKKQLVDAIQKANTNKTAAARKNQRRRMSSVCRPSR